jgi:hypothetical protein
MPPLRYRRALSHCCGVLAALAVGLSPGLAVDKPPAKESLTYRIRAQYDPQQKQITAHEVIHWTNRTAQPTSELQLHLYLNAFANNRSSFLRGERGWKEWSEKDPEAWGYITMSRVSAGKEDLTGRVQFIHPDDNNAEDRTVAQVLLPVALVPGDSIELEIDFEARLPRLLARTGHAGAFAMVAQWFPKLGVFEDGRWVCHQYHADSEFYAEFGEYDVTLTVPIEGVVGATGELRDERVNADGTRTLRFVAQKVHDFAWVIDPRFRVFERQVDGVNIRLLMQPWHARQAERHLAAASTALAWYGEHIGAYPYGQLTIVDPGPGGDAAGGMEYPMLITSGTRWWIPRWLRLPEAVVVHEIGHQYWYGMVANNEAEEAWLDEGVNSYTEGLIMDAAYGPASYGELFGLKLDALAMQRLEYLRAPAQDPLTRRAWEYLDSRSYHAISYAKTALLLRTLDNTLEDRAVLRALRSYFERWRFGHPRGTDLWSVLGQESGARIDVWHPQLVNGTEVLDYAVTRVRAERDPGFAGHRVDVDEAGEAQVQSEDGERRYRSEVVVERLGGIRMPVAVEITFEDGSKLVEHWDGETPWKRFEYTGAQRVEWAVVDPERKLVLDINWLNNSRMRSGGTRGLIRIASGLGFWMQNLVHVLSGL